MSFLEEFKSEVSDEEALLVTNYQQFMLDYVLPQIVKSVTKSAIINKTDLSSSDIDYKLFIAWLNEEKFPHILSGTDSILINFEGV